MSDSTPPPRIAAPGGPEYQLSSDLYALPGEAPSDAAPVADLGGVRVYRGAAAPGAGPVYTLAGGTMAVPTGRAFVRFREGSDPREAEEALGGAGFRIESVPAYAPHAAWVAHQGGSVAEGLQGIDALRQLPGVVHVEPEILTPRASR